MEAARQESAADDRMSISADETTTQSVPSGTSVAAAEPLESQPSAEVQAACADEETEVVAGGGAAAASAGVADDEVDPKPGTDLTDATSTKASSKKKQRKNKKKKR